jgi:glycosyltransferase involved in cell wall biosynthesis
MTLRVLFATEHIHFPQGGGGAERNTHELCIALCEKGAEVAVLSSFSPDYSWLSLSARARRFLFPRYEFQRDSGCGYDVFRGWNLDRAGELVGRFKPDVIILQSIDPDRLLKAFAPARIPLCLYLHEVESIDHLRKFSGTGLTILANSDFTAQCLARQCRLQSTVILPLVDSRYYLTTVRPTRVLFINTVPRKGLEIAFEIAENRRDVGFDFVLSWILAPERVKELEGRARASGNIVLHRPTDNMRALYRHARLVLAPSLVRESWGRIATEAHINGIPVLGSDRGGLPEAIGPGGLTVPAEASLARWLEAFSNIWDDPKRYDAYAQAARDYSRRPDIQPDHILDKLLATLNSAAAPQAPLLDRLSAPAPTVAV